MVAAPPLSKDEYLKRYLSVADAGQERVSESLRKRYKIGAKLGGTTGNGLQIVDDDVGWAAISTAKPEKEEEEDGDLPVVAEFVDEHPQEKTVFRDKSGQKRNLKLERLEQRRKAEKESEGDELYAHWGKGLGQSRQQQQNVEDAMKEMQKPLARYIDDEDLDRMLREQEREGDPMADFIKKNNAEENKHKKAGPRYNGPAPPPIDSESGLDTAGREWTGPMASNRSALPGSPAKRLWRSLPTSGVWRTCSFSKAVWCCGGGGPGQPDIQL
ncbi:BUD13-like protein [Microtus ochrogaster]|uniref:BUD13 homolog n=1 Tax=Microtus ochrogaster TaxID=79684 RepID=A0A8J6L277_MICOH|nr:BUD13-like protein [Microtus ochrogaster]